MSAITFSVVSNGSVKIYFTLYQTSLKSDVINIPVLGGSVLSQLNFTESCGNGFYNLMM